MIFALVGNPNCGKTTLFNILTGANQRVGNFPGVTVEQKMGKIRETRHQVVDLPGIYSLRPYTQEEVITRDFLQKQKPDAILNLVDAINPERNLYLTLQLLTLQIPMVVALNRMDALVSGGGSVNTEKMAEALGVPVLAISAAREEGIAQMLETISRIATDRILPKRQKLCPDGPVQRCLRRILDIVENGRCTNFSSQFCAVALIEGERKIAGALALTQREQTSITRIISEMEYETGLDRNAALADMRYSLIEKICEECVVKPEESKEHLRSIRIDRLLTNRYFAIPLFFGIMGLVFFMTFGLIGTWLSDRMADAVGGATLLADQMLAAWNVHPVIQSLIIDGIFSGVGNVLSFLPLVVTLFFFLSILEDTGYMARVSFIMDRLLGKIGLSGKSIVPMLTGFGCSVPAIMAARTLPSQRDRKMTVLLIPFMSCSAKIPIYCVFSAAFFPGKVFFVMMVLYAGGVLAGILAALLLNKIAFRGQSSHYILELPDYRFPTLRSVRLLVWEKAKDFIGRAFTVVFGAALVIWFLQSFNLQLKPTSSGSESILAVIGRWLVPVFTPLGFGDWRMVTALLSGFTAKESVVSTLAVTLGVGTDGLPEALGQVFTPASAASFLTFCLLYTPCVAAVAALRREWNSTWKTVCIVLLQCIIAWIAAFIIYRLFAALKYTL